MLAAIMEIEFTAVREPVTSSGEASRIRASGGCCGRGFDLRRRTDEHVDEDELDRDVEEEQREQVQRAGKAHVLGANEIDGVPHGRIERHLDRKGLIVRVGRRNGRLGLEAVAGGAQLGENFTLELGAHLRNLCAHEPRN